MRRLQRFFFLLYPVRWRARYGDEFQAMLEQLNPGWMDMANLLSGAVRMHLTEWSYLRTGVVLSMLGCLAGGLIQFAIHDRYVSDAVVTVPSASRGAEAVRKLLSRSSLKQVIEANGLYESERKRQPLEDVIEQMRTHDLAVSAISATRLSIRFESSEKVATQGTVRDLIAGLERDPEFHTEVPARPPDLFYPNRLVLFGVWLAGTVLAGYLATAITKRLRA